MRFAYPGGRQPAHDGLSFKVAAGEKIGIVGPSGSGKSSIARLLLRLFDPQSGAVRIGGLRSRHRLVVERNGDRVEMWLGLVLALEVRQHDFARRELARGNAPRQLGGPHPRELSDLAHGG